MVAGWAKQFGVSPDTVLYDMSWTNLVLYSAALPRYGDKKRQKWDESKDANNPDNCKGADEIWV